MAAWVDGPAAATPLEVLSDGAAWGWVDRLSPCRVAADADSQRAWQPTRTQPRRLSRQPCTRTGQIRRQ
jgi:hypothetical protein